MFLLPKKNSAKNNTGFTLAEIMVSAGLLSGVAVLIVTLVQSTARTNIQITKGQNSLYSITRAHYGLLGHLNQAINIEAANPTGFNLGAATAGRVQAYDSDTLAVNTAANAATAGNVDTLAIFHREGRRSQEALTYSQIESVGIYFQRPTPTTSGVLYISRSAVNGAVQLRPFQDNTAFPTLRGAFYPDLTRVQITNLQTEPTTNRLSGLTITLSGRTFTAGDPGDYRWCSQADMTAVAACNAGQIAPYRDIDRIINITFRNNTIFGGATGTASPTGAGSNIEERVLGPLYFFSFSAPRGF